MGANCPPQVVTADRADGTVPLDELGEPLRLNDDSLSALVLERLGQMFCGIQGHEHMTQFNNGRMFLRCITCGHESPGWDVPTRLFAAKASLPKARIAPRLPSKRVA